MDRLIKALNLIIKRERVDIVATLGLVFNQLNKVESRTSIEKILSFHRGGIWGDEAAKHGQGYPVLRSTNMRGMRSDTNDVAWRQIRANDAERCKLQTGDILVIKSSGSSDLVGKATIFIHPNDGNQYLFSNFTLMLRPDPNKILSDYLAWFLRSPQSLLWRIEAQQTTVGLRNLKTKEFLNQSIPIPNLKTQKIVVDYFDSIEVNPNLVEKIVPPFFLQKDHNIISKIHKTMTNVTEVRKERVEAIKETLDFNQKLIQAQFLPHYDKMRKVGEIFRVTTGGTPSRSNPLYWNGDINWISSGEVNFSRISGTYEKITRLGNENSNAKINPPNTVLVAMIGQGKTRGQCAILDCFSATNQNVAAIHVYETENIPEYVYWWFYSQYVESRTSETGTAQPALSGQRIKEMFIPIPSPQEQHRIVAYLDRLQAKVDEVKRLQVETEREIEALVPAVLAKAFAGE